MSYNYKALNYSALSLNDNPKANGTPYFLPKHLGNIFCQNKLNKNSRWLEESSESDLEDEILFCLY